jgi:hypothetical protein
MTDWGASRKEKEERKRKGAEERKGSGVEKRRRQRDVREEKHWQERGREANEDSGR